MSELEIGDKVDLPQFNDATVVEKIDKRDLKPLWDAHEHKYVRDEEETEHYYAEVCESDGCGMGRLIRKV